MRTTPLRIASVTLVSLGLLVAGALPASADPVIVDWNAPYPYSFLETLGLFVGIPLAVFGLVILAVYGPGWSKSGSDDDTTPQAVRETSPAGSMAAPSGPGIITPSGPTDHTERGGASAEW